MSCGTSLAPWPDTLMVASWTRHSESSRSTRRDGQAASGRYSEGYTNLRYKLASLHIVAITAASVARY